MGGGGVEKVRIKSKGDKARVKNKSEKVGAKVDSYAKAGI